MIPIALWTDDKKEIRKQNREYRNAIMTEDEMRLVDDLITVIDQNRGNMGKNYDEWEKLQEAYAGDQAIEQNRPNTRVNILHANIEGQVSSLVDQNIAVVCRGTGPSDQPFSRWGNVSLDWALRQNKVKLKIARHERRRELFGVGVFKLWFNPDAFDGFGLPTIETPSLNSVFIDSKITDYMRIQEADYIAEVMYKSITWAKQEYGKKADYIYLGSDDKSAVWTKERTDDDDNGFWLIQVWTKTDGNLRMLEFSSDGVLLYDSFDDAKDEPFYRYNKYPYWVTPMYEIEGELWGFGDGKLLRPLQDMINDLYDQIRRAARPNRVFFDPQSEVDLEDLDEDDGPVPCNDPNATIRVVDIGQVNNALWSLLGNVHNEVQRVTRFSELMIGASTRQKTATEASIQQQQGSSGSEFKKMMLQQTLEDICYYMLDMMLEKWQDGGRWFRIDEDKDDFEWIDFREMSNIAIQVPAEEGYIKNFMLNNPDMPMPQYQPLTDSKGKSVTKSVDFDIEVNIGAGLPKNKVFIYQMLQALSQMVVEGKNVISWVEFRNLAKDILGLPLEEVTKEQLAPPQGMEQDALGGLLGEMGASGGSIAKPNAGSAPSADTMGMAANGSPMAEMSNSGAMGGLMNPGGGGAF